LKILEIGQKGVAVRGVLLASVFKKKTGPGHRREENRGSYTLLPKRNRLPWRKGGAVIDTEIEDYFFAGKLDQRRIPSSRSSEIRDPRLKKKGKAKAEFQPWSSHHR